MPLLTLKATVVAMLLASPVAWLQIHPKSSPRHPDLLMPPAEVASGCQDSFLCVLTGKVQHNRGGGSSLKSACNSVSIDSKTCAVLCVVIHFLVPVGVKFIEL